jgi:acyl-coenzyme A thioesterase PaaI-like protein
MSSNDVPAETGEPAPPGAAAWAFGEAPLPETVELAERLRRVAGLVLSTEAPSAAVRALSEQLTRAERELAAEVPASARPRVGADVEGDGRVYLDHSRHIGAFNPAFPCYEIRVAGDRAEGEVEFPVLYEGPPGVVHGGFVAVFFDLVIQHHNCDVGVAGKTTRLEVRYRRPTPLGSPLRFEIERVVRETRIESTARLLRGDELCAQALVGAIAGDQDALPPVSPRRSA